MPTAGGYCYSSGSKLRLQAIAEVQAKFPDLPKDSSGWWRAVENRYKRLAKSF